MEAKPPRFFLVRPLRRLTLRLRRRRRGPRATASAEPMPRPFYYRVLRSTPMPVLAMLVGLGAGLLVWGVLDQVQSDKIKRIFASDLRTELDMRSRESLIRFDQYLANYTATARLLANHRRLASYLGRQVWHAGQSVAPVVYRAFPPFWLLAKDGQYPRGVGSDPWGPDFFSRNGLSPPSHVVLADLDGKVREVFQAGEAALPAELAGGVSASLLPEGGRVRTVLTRFGDRPYLLVSDAVENAGGVVMGSLLVVVPVDAAFLAASQRGLAPGQVLVALVDPEEQRILASMEPDLLFPGTLIPQWQDRYLITTQSLPAYEGWDWYPLLATFIPHDSVKRMTQRVRDLERRQRTIAALAFILVFTAIIYLVSSRLNHVLKRMSRFSQRALGIAEPNFQRAGNQLLLLEDWIKHFTQLVLRAREELNRQHETAMRRSEALKAAMMEASLDSIVTLNRRGEVIELNPTAEHALGYTRNQTIGSLFVETCVAAADRDRFDQLLEESLRARREGGAPPARRELTALRRDGTQVPVELSIVPIHLERNLFYTLYIHDMTQRRLAELEIQSLARFAGESPNPILRVGSDAVITYANPASQGLLTALDRSQGQALPAEWARLVAAALEEGRAREQEWDLGGRLYAVLFAPIPESAYVNLYARDITAVRRAEQEARQHQAELVHVCRLSTMGEVATGMAHELNQPLAAIANYASGASRRLQGGTPDPASLVEAMGQITSQARRAGEIIRRLRGLVGKQAPSRGEVDLNHLVREVCSFVEFETGRLGVRIALDLAPGKIPVAVDLVQIEQVLLNLLTNALDALEEVEAPERNLCIRTALREGEAEVRVEDTGPGITSEGLERLFEPFYTTKSKGMGMGLAISQTIAEDHGGRIRAESTLGQGTCFHLVLPVAETRAEAGQDGETACS